VLAAVRSATDPLSVSPANTQPFCYGPLSFVHNGYIDGFSSTVLRRLRSELSDEQYARIQGNTDSEHLFALVLDEYGRSSAQSGDRLADAVRRALSRARALAVEAEKKALFSVVVADGRALFAARSAAGAEPPSLYARPLELGALVASERLDDDPGWTPLASDSALLIERGLAPRRVEL
jgi:glutamine amidotransferase